jgi:hypothetical protein
MSILGQAGLAHLYGNSFTGLNRRDTYAPADNPAGVECSLKRLLPEAAATGFQDPPKGGWELVGPSPKNNCARGARLEANRCILVVTGEPKS